MKQQTTRARAYTRVRRDKMVAAHLTVAEWENFSKLCWQRNVSRSEAIRELVVNQLVSEENKNAID